jgi:choline dehydrogenase-like flavoprotein
VDSPGVGQNLQDHVIGLVGPFTVNQVNGKHLTYLPSRDSSPADLMQYLQNGIGPLSQAGVVASGFLASNASLAERDANGIVWPDIQLILLAIPKDRDGVETLAKIYNLKKEIAQEFYEPVYGEDSFHIMSISSRPKSRGHIELANADPKTPPLIDPNYYHDPHDIATTVEGIRKALNLVENTKTFQDIGAKLSTVPFPSCKNEEFKSDQYWECYLRHYTLSVYHPTSTCSMGKRDDPQAVVDGRLNVIGTERLRVIDASVFPQIVSSNIQAAVTMVSEVGSQFVKEYWGIAP